MVMRTTFCAVPIMKRAMVARMPAVMPRVEPAVPRSPAIGRGVPVNDNGLCVVDHDPFSEWHVVRGPLVSDNHLRVVRVIRGFETRLVLRPCGAFADALPRAIGLKTGRAIGFTNLASDPHRSGVLPAIRLIGFGGGRSRAENGQRGENGRKDAKGKTFHDVSKSFLVARPDKGAVLNLQNQDIMRSSQNHGIGKVFWPQSGSFREQNALRRERRALLRGRDRIYGRKVRGKGLRRAQRLPTRRGLKKDGAAGRC